MQEEIKDVVNNCVCDETTTYLPEVSSKKGFIKSTAFKVGVLGLVTGIATGIGVLVKKNKGKLTNYRVKKLEKKGFIVISPEQQFEASEEDFLATEN